MTRNTQIQQSPLIKPTSAGPVDLGLIKRLDLVTGEQIFATLARINSSGLLAFLLGKRFVSLLTAFRFVSLLTAFSVVGHSMADCTIAKGR